MDILCFIDEDDVLYWGVNLYHKIWLRENKTEQNKSKTPDSVLMTYFLMWQKTQSRLSTLMIKSDKSIHKFRPTDVRQTVFKVTKQARVFELSENINPRTEVIK